jgi:hypothetical protein
MTKAAPLMLMWQNMPPNIMELPCHTLTLPSLPEMSASLVRMLTKTVSALQALAWLPIPLNLTTRSNSSHPLVLTSQTTTTTITITTTTRTATTKTFKSTNFARRSTRQLPSAKPTWRTLATLIPPDVNTLKTFCLNTRKPSEVPAAVLNRRVEEQQ